MLGVTPDMVIAAAKELLPSGPRTVA
jgi:hypothetical protein